MFGDKERGWPIGVCWQDFKTAELEMDAVKNFIIPEKWYLSNWTSLC